MEIGRVYVEDPDDWDLGDKVFEKVDDPYNMFTVERDGMILMRGSAATPGNTYTLRASVRDQTRPNDRKAYGK